MIQLFHGDCLEVLKTLEPSYVDSLITDPPAGISFMGKSWDDDKGGRDHWIEWLTEVMDECSRVLKPGAHALVWAIPRTSHWTTTAIENAGFEIRDVITHLFGSGFPKSLDVSKAIDKLKGLEPSEAKQWQGFGTALKPAAEFWVLARKPLSEKTVAKNVLKWGAGALNIDGARIGTENLSKQYAREWNSNNGEMGKRYSQASRETGKQVPDGRFPANLVFSCSPHCADDQHDIECAIKMLDEQSGVLVSKYGTQKKFGPGKSIFGIGAVSNANNFTGDSGGASRFFYCAKVSSKERNEGLEGLEPARSDYRLSDDSSKNTIRERLHNSIPKLNHHPTVKPIKLMSYLIKLITPPEGIVLDPFMGSGSTGVACKRSGFNFIGIEKEQDYFVIAEKRING